MPKYSIILPVRNGGEHVKDCIKSILAQTITDFNLHILDNCSTDGTSEWLSSLPDNRIRIYRSEEFLTIEKNWSRMVTIPRNEFMTFIGHDDLLDRNFLQAMENLIKKHPNASLYQAHFRYIDENGNKIRSCKPMDEKQSVYEFLAFFLSGIFDLSTGQMMRSADFDEIGGIPDYENLLFADFELWNKLIEKSYRASTFEECCSYRIHIKSTTKSSTPIKYYHAFIRLVEYFIKLKKEDEKFAIIFQNYGLDFLRPYCKSTSHHLLRVSKKERDGITVAAFISQFKRNVDELISDNNFYPEREFTIKLARQIDSNSFLRSMFLMFKRFYSKPVLH